MLKRLDLRAEYGDLEALLPRPAEAGADVAGPVAAIIDEVRQRGDLALRELTAKFDGVDRDELRVPPAELEAARARISPELREALVVAWERIVDYHRASLSTPGRFERPGLRVEHREVPVERAGIYAPGGLARYPSSVLMGAAPAVVAGVGELVLCVPPAAGGRVDDATLAAAAVAGIDEVYAVGGAQAIAAMALGTQQIRRVDVIAGPGNAYVAEAKRQLSGTVGIAAAFAGPSEITVVADGSADASLVAIDLMVQAEHGPDGMAWLVTWSEQLAAEVDVALAELVAASPRAEVLRSTFASAGLCALVRDLEQAMAVSNVIAPEHLELQTEDNAAAAALVTKAGAVFCGRYAPATLGDYAAGPNHVLPTNRTARFGSALRSEDFIRHIHVVEVDESAFAELAPTVVALAEAEGLAAHAESIRMRGMR